MLVEVRVQSLGLDRTTKGPVVILQEKEGDRVLPIWIGPAEAHSIAMQLADFESPRPQTHDLLVSVLTALEGELQKVVITRVVDGTYFAELLVRRNGSMVVVDARPSDSIAVALRVGASIYSHDGLLERASIEVTEDEDLDVDLSGPETAGPTISPSEAMGPEELQEHLRRLNPEDFGRFTP